MMNNPFDLEKFEKEFCESEIPSGFNLYKFIKENPNTTIAAAIHRIRRIMNRADIIMIGISGGKDSTLTFELTILELKYRIQLQKIINDNNFHYNFINDTECKDAQFGKYNELENIRNNHIPQILCNSMDSEWIYTDPQNHIRKDISQKYSKGCFIDGSKIVLGSDILPKKLQKDNCITYYDLWQIEKEKAIPKKINSFEVGLIRRNSNYLLDDMGYEDGAILLKTDLLTCVYEGQGLINMFYKCLEIGWQSGITFNDSRLISWDPDKKDMWIREMPSRYDIGFDICKTDNLNINYVPDKNGIIKINDISCTSNFGFGNKNLICNDRLKDKINCWTFKNQNEDMEQETFGEWLIQNTNNKNIYNLVSLRAAESFDRYTILKQSNYYTGNYGNIKCKETNTVMYFCSPVMDFTTEDVWRLFSATNWNVSKIYEKMYDAGIAIKNQRIGSLLNFCATKNIAQVKSLEPDMYAKINARFQNIEFMSNFSKSGYYKIGKPLDSIWNGRSHIKAGVNDVDNTKLTDKYERILTKYKDELKDIGITNFGRNKDNTFTFTKESNDLQAINPLQDLLNNNLVKNEDIDEVKELNIIHVTWRDYCLYMLNTTSEPLRSSWREKLITDILAWRYSEKAVELSTMDALNILSELNQEIVKKVTDDYWSKDDFHVNGTLPISQKTVISISHYPQESLEKECADVIKYLINENNFDELKKSENFMRFADKCIRTKKMIFPSEVLNNMYLNKYNDNNLIRNEDYYSEEEMNIEEFGQEWKNRVLKGTDIWFKENVKSSANWKRFAINILKGDTIGKYVGFAQTYSERLARAKAIEAFDKKQQK